MIRIIALLLLAFACSPQNSTEEQTSSLRESMPFFSQHVQDSFHLSVQKPLEYADSTAQQYPVVYLLDANFYFPMLAPVLHQYEKAGLLPPLILVGMPPGKLWIRSGSGIISTRKLYPPMR